MHLVLHSQSTQSRWPTKIVYWQLSDFVCCKIISWVPAIQSRATSSEWHTKIFSYRNYFIVKIICPNLVTCYLLFLCLWWQLPIHYSITCQQRKLSFQLDSQIITVSFLENFIQCWNEYSYPFTMVNNLNMLKYENLFIWI